MPRFQGVPVEEQTVAPRFKGQPVAPDDAALNDLSALTQSAGNAQGDMPVSLREKIGGPVAGLMNGAMDALTLGFKDEIGAAADSAGSHIFPWRDPKTYDQALAETRGTSDAIAKEHPYANTAGVLTGALMGGAGLAKAGLSPTANAIKAGAGLGKVSLLSGAEGALLGGAQGFGSGEGGFTDRAKNAGIGFGTGLAAGAITPGLIAGATTLTEGALAPIMARLNPGKYSQQALGQALQRAGMSPDDVASVLSRSQADDQGMFTVADAMGNSGQRLLSTVARNPSDARQGVIEALQSRQAGQGRRLQSALTEGFGANETAAGKVASLVAARDEAADKAYEMARYGLVPDDFKNAVVPADTSVESYLKTLPRPRVDVRNVISAIDDRIGPMQGSGVSGDSIDAALTGFRNRLTAPADKLPEGVTAVDLADFDRVLNVKKDLRDAIEVARRAGQGNRVRELNKIHSVLDKALEDASPAYRTANDEFANASRVIDAVGKGRDSAMRGRVEDTIPAFRGMTQDQQSAFRAGYADPYIADIQKTAGPMTNRARPLITDATKAEFPAFAVPGKADQMGNRIAREQRMFETANAALGGSKTADNLADAAELAKFDPGIMSKMMRGDVIGALMEGGRKIMNEASGTQPRVVEQIAKALMQTDPGLARDALLPSAKRIAASQDLRSKVVSALINSAAAGGGRLAAP